MKLTTEKELARWGSIVGFAICLVATLIAIKTSLLGGLSPSWWVALVCLMVNAGWLACAWD